MMPLLTKDLFTGNLLEVSHTENNSIVISECDKNCSFTESDNLWIAPGLVDLQVNGYAGIDFSDANFDAEKAEHIAKQMLGQGVTSFLATVTTNSFESLSNSFKNLFQARESSQLFNAFCSGFHLEGPWICPEDGPRGAHPKQHCRSPNLAEFERLQESANGEIRLVTLSPEYGESPKFISELLRRKVNVSIGHTNANGEQIRRAIDSGATLSTHLGNGAHAQITRHPNYIWDQLAADELTAMLITDGHHLPGNVAKSFVRAKKGNVILTSDLTALAGMPVGRYESVLGSVEVLEDGRLVVAGQRAYLAGASRTLIECVDFATELTEADLKTAWEWASTKAKIAIGFGSEFDSDFVIFERIGDSAIGNRLKVCHTIKSGTIY